MHRGSAELRNGVPHKNSSNPNTSLLTIQLIKLVVAIEIYVCLGETEVSAEPRFSFCGGFCLPQTSA